MSLKFVAFDASTVKSFCAPRPLEKVSLLSCRATPAGAGGGAFSFSRCATHLWSRYTPTVSNASKHAVAADQRAHLAASLRFMLSVKQNFGVLYTKARYRARLPLIGALNARENAYALPAFTRDAGAGR